MSEIIQGRNPSIGSSRDTIAGIFSLKDSSDRLALECCTPGIVLSYDRAGGTAMVRPLVKKVTGDGKTQERAPIRLSVRRSLHGSFMVDAPLHVGDTGWIVAADRDTFNAKALNSKIQAKTSGIGLHDDNGEPIGNSGAQTPGVYSTHKYQFGFFVPDRWGGIELPAELADSLVVQQVLPDGTSHARAAMDPDGTIRIFSTRWFDAESSSLAGGSVLVDLSWKGKLPDEPVETWREGDVDAIANLAVRGDLAVAAWKDPDGKTHGGNLAVAKDADIKGSLAVGLWARVKGALTVLGESLFRKRLIVREDSKAVVLDPKRDLAKSDAKFREVLVVTGLDHDRDKNNRVGLKVQKMRALVDRPEQTNSVEFDVGGGGGDEYVRGSDTNIVFTKRPDGKTAINVYYI